MENQMFVVFVEDICRENDASSRGHKNAFPGDPEPEEWLAVKDLPINDHFGHGAVIQGHTVSEADVQKWCREYNTYITEDGRDQTCCTSHAYYLPFSPLEPFKRPEPGMY